MGISEHKGDLCMCFQMLSFPVLSKHSIILWLGCVFQSVCRKNVFVNAPLETKHRMSCAEWPILTHLQFTQKLFFCARVHQDHLWILFPHRGCLWSLKQRQSGLWHSRSHFIACEWSHIPLPGCYSWWRGDASLTLNPDGIRRCSTELRVCRDATN